MTPLNESNSFLLMYRSRVSSHFFRHHDMKSQAVIGSDIGSFASHFFVNRFIEGFLVSHAALVYAPPDGRMLESKENKPISQKFCFPSIFDVNIRASISHLFFKGEPSAIRWIVISKCVNAVKAVFWRRSSAHISVEIFKLRPALANLYSSCAVKTVRLSIWVMATLSHQSPAHMFWGVVEAMRPRRHEQIISGELQA